MQRSLATLEPLSPRQPPLNSSLWALIAVVFGKASHVSCACPSVPPVCAAADTGNLGGASGDSQSGGVRSQKRPRAFASCSLSVTSCTFTLPTSDSIHNMHVFVTGASGFVGSAVVQELLSHGHTVIGLARSQASADKLKLAGAEVLHGSVRDLEALKAGATQADGVIHLAFNHDFSRWLDSCREDGEAIDALGSALVDTGKPLVVTSGVGVLSVSRAPGSTTPCAEDDPSPTSASQMPRIQSELSALPLAQQGVRVSVVRLTPTVHGKGDVGFIPAMIRAARDRSAAAYVETGDNVWPTVHRDDAAVLYRLALEKASAGSILHAVHETASLSGTSRPSSARVSTCRSTALRRTRPTHTLGGSLTLPRWTCRRAATRPRRRSAGSPGRSDSSRTSKRARTSRPAPHPALSPSAAPLASSPPVVVALSCPISRS